MLNFLNPFKKSHVLTIYGSNLLILAKSVRKGQCTLQNRNNLEKRSIQSGNRFDLVWIVLLDCVTLLFHSSDIDEETLISSSIFLETRIFWAPHWIPLFWSAFLQKRSPQKNSQPNGQNWLNIIEASSNLTSERVAQAYNLISYSLLIPFFVVRPFFWKNFSVRWSILKSHLLIQFLTEIVDFERQLLLRFLGYVTPTNESKDHETRIRPNVAGRARRRWAAIVLGNVRPFHVLVPMPKKS